MKDDSETKSRGRVGFTLCVLVLYVLSCGPAVRPRQEGYVSDKFIDILYAPLGLLMDNCQPVDDTINWYVNLWES